MEKRVIETVQKTLGDYTKRTELRIKKEYERRPKDIIDFDDVVFYLVDLLSE